MLILIAFSVCDLAKFVHWFCLTNIKTETQEVVLKYALMYIVDTTL